MTDLDLDAIEARANAATEGPWLAYDERSDLREENPDVNPMWVVAHMEPDGVNWVRDIADIGGGEQDETDAEFIAHARTDVPALVAALREARAEVERLRTVEVDSISVLSVAWPQTTVPWIAEVGVAACISLLTAERDDWRRRYEALRDGVTRLCDRYEHAEQWENPPSGQTVAAKFHNLVARVEGDES